MKAREAEYTEQNTDAIRDTCYQINNDNLSLNDVQADFSPFVLRLDNLGGGKGKTQAVVSLLTDEKHELWAEKTGVKVYPTAQEIENGWSPESKAEAVEKAEVKADKEEKAEADAASKVDSPVSTKLPTPTKK